MCLLVHINWEWRSPLGHILACTSWAIHKRKYSKTLLFTVFQISHCCSPVKITMYTKLHIVGESALITVYIYRDTVQDTLYQGKLLINSIHSGTLWENIHFGRNAYRCEWIFMEGGVFFGKKIKWDKTNQRIEKWKTGKLMLNFPPFFFDIWK